MSGRLKTHKEIVIAKADKKGRDCFFIGDYSQIYYSLLPDKVACPFFENINCYCEEEGEVAISNFFLSGFQAMIAMTASQNLRRT